MYLCIYLHIDVSIYKSINLYGRAEHLKNSKAKA